jgi:cytochrome c556|tara:strand:+ start:27 stop:440 length:414 start_codon:yes stop_codon:yes gene_type:complete
MREILMLMIFLATPAVADDHGQYKYREGIMQSIRGQMGALGAIVRNDVQAENMMIHARAMSDLAGILPDVFPKGSAVEKSEALSVVWEDTEAFEEATDGFITLTSDFLQAVENDGDVPGTFRNLQKSCKGCHDKFRE